MEKDFRGKVLKLINRKIKKIEKIKNNHTGYDFYQKSLLEEKQIEILEELKENILKMEI